MNSLKSLYNNSENFSIFTDQINLKLYELDSSHIQSNVINNLEKYEIFYDAIADEGNTTNSKKLNFFGDKLTKVSLVLDEFVTTEKAYLDDLTIILSEYLIPLQNYLHCSGTESFQIQHVVEEISNLRNLSQKFYNQTMVDSQIAGLTHQINTVCQALIQLETEYETAYRTYCNNFQTINTMISNTNGHRQNNMSEFLARRQKDLGHNLPFTSFLLKPIQRISKYPLLLNNLKKAVMEMENNNLIVIEKAHMGMTRVAYNVNTYLKIQENQSRLHTILANGLFVNFPKTLLNNQDNNVIQTDEHIQHNFYQLFGPLLLESPMCLRIKTKHPIRIITTKSPAHNVENGKNKNWQSENHRNYSSSQPCLTTFSSKSAVTPNKESGSGNDTTNMNGSNRFYRSQNHRHKLEYRMEISDVKDRYGFLFQNALLICKKRVKRFTDKPLQIFSNNNSVSNETNVIKVNGPHEDNGQCYSFKELLNVRHMRLKVTPPTQLKRTNIKTPNSNNLLAKYIVKLQYINFFPPAINNASRCENISLFGNSIINNINQKANFKSYLNTNVITSLTTNDLINSKPHNNPNGLSQFGVFQGSNFVNSQQDVPRENNTLQYEKKLYILQFPNVSMQETWYQTLHDIVNNRGNYTNMYNEILTPPNQALEPSSIKPKTIIAENRVKRKNSLKPSRNLLQPENSNGKSKNSQDIAQLSSQFFCGLNIDGTRTFENCQQTDKKNHIQLKQKPDDFYQLPLIEVQDTGNTLEPKRNTNELKNNASEYLVSLSSADIIKDLSQLNWEQRSFFPATDYQHNLNCSTSTNPFRSNVTQNNNLLYSNDNKNLPQTKTQFSPTKNLINISTDLKINYNKTLTPTPMKHLHVYKDNNQIGSKDARYDVLRWSQASNHSSVSSGFFSLNSADISNTSTN